MGGGRKPPIHDPRRSIPVPATGHYAGNAPWRMGVNDTVPLRLPRRPFRRGGHHHDWIPHDPRSTPLLLGAPPRGGGYRGAGRRRRCPPARGATGEEGGSEE